MILPNAHLLSVMSQASADIPNNSKPQLPIMFIWTCMFYFDPSNNQIRQMWIYMLYFDSSNNQICQIISMLFNWY